MQRLIGMAVGLLISVVLFTWVAIAQDVAAPLATTDGTNVTINWGDYVVTLLAGVGAIILTIVTWAFRKLPVNVQAFLLAWRAEQLLKNAVNWGINATAGAVKGKALTINVGNGVTAAAVTYAVNHAPKLVEQMGGLDMVRQKVQARLDFDEAAVLPH